MSESGSEFQDDFEGWEEDQIPTKSLFDHAEFPKAAESLVYDHQKYGFDLIGLLGELQCDDLEAIRIVNYLRKETPSATLLSKKTTQDFRIILADDQYLQPVLPDDGLLQLDYEELLAKNAKSPISTDRLKVTALTQQLQSLQAAYSDLQEMLRLRIEEDSLDVHGHAGPSLGQTKQKADGEDVGYFKSYAENEIHEVMLKDKIRTEGYRDAMQQGVHFFKDAVVLDVGCGTGILSMFAVKAGAKHVYAVDASDIAHRAMANVVENDLHDRITVIKGKIEEVHLPIHKVDIIISEWMGYFLLYESMLDSVLHARDRFLRPGGLVLPSRCTLKLCAVGSSTSEDSVNHRIDYWKDVYGYKMPSMQEEVFEEAQVMFYDPAAMISQALTLQDFDLASIKADQVLPFTAHLDLEIQKDDTVYALLAWFDTEFYGDKSIQAAFTTCPGKAGETHWRQTAFALRKPIAVQAGQAIKVSFSCKKRQDHARELEVTADLTIEGGQTVQTWVIS